MSRTSLSLSVDDVSAFTKALGRQLAALERAPGHVELLNMVSRATGYRNFQHFRAQSKAARGLDAPKPAPEAVDYIKVKRLLRYFDAEGRFARWPKKHSHQGVCLWALWSRIPARRVFSEREISDLLQDAHLFGDHALLRRELFDRGLVARTPDGREYRRLERKPPPEAVELIARLGA